MLWSGGCRLLALVVAGLLVACVGPGPGQSSAARSPSGAEVTGQSSAPRRIVTAVVGQPSTWVERLRSGPRVGAWNLFELATAGLTLIDSQGDLQPQLAQTVPTIENGLWRVLPDGTMETTWRLRPNLKW